MNTNEIIEKIRQIESPLKRQLLMVALITRLLEQSRRVKTPPENNILSELLELRGKVEQ